MAEQERKKKLTVRSVPTRHVTENFKKIAKKFNKQNNTIMASFQAKIGWKTQRRRENKYYHSVPFCSDPKRNRKFQKNSKKIQKIKKYHYGFISSQNRLENAKKERI